jgi:hypothetical protein
LPCFRALTRYVGGKRKTMRTVKEINIPTEIDIEFLKVNLVTTAPSFVTAYDKKLYYSLHIYVITANLELVFSFKLIF